VVRGLVAHDEADPQRVVETDRRQLRRLGPDVGEVVTLQRGLEPGVRTTLDAHEHTFA
jgi:hypothetical protein